MDWTQVVIVAVPVVVVLIILLMVLKPVRRLIDVANEFELNRDGLKIRTQRQVAELQRETAAAFPGGQVHLEADDPRVISMASPDQRDSLPLPDFREYLSNIAALDPRAAVLEAFERIQAGLATRFGKRSFPPPGTAEAAELVQLALDSHQYRAYELMYPVYVAARRNEGFSLSHDTALQFCQSAVSLIWLIEGNPAVRALGIKVAPHEHLGLFEDADLGEDTKHRWDHVVLDVVSESFFLEEEPGITDEELAFFIWGLVLGLEPEPDDRSKRIGLRWRVASVPC